MHFSKSMTMDFVAIVSLRCSRRASRRALWLLCYISVSSASQRFFLQQRQRLVARFSNQCTNVLSSAQGVQIAAILQRPRRGQNSGFSHS